MKYVNSLCTQVSQELQISTESEDPIFTDTVIIGNGPSGIALSFLLAGNWPFYNGDEHPDELLNARLKTCSKHIPLLLQDLEFLSQSMEGRCRNQISNLIDALTHPNSELEINHPSVLEYQYLPDKFVDHIVIGKGTPGGLWQNIDKDIRTLSFSNWMSLPGLPFEVWENKVDVEIRRVEAGLVAQYYEEYVKLMKLSKYFRNNSQVIRIEPKSAEDGRVRWQVFGYDNEQNKSFTYKCHRVILATGTSDVPNIVNVPGEFSFMGRVFHCLTGFEKAIEDLVNRNSQIVNDVRSVDPVLIVGSGFSAFDAAVCARKYKIPIMHLVRKDAIPAVERQLNRIYYPEYFELKELENTVPAMYKQYVEYTLSEIQMKRGKLVITMRSPETELTSYTVSLVAILTGSRADLSYLPISYQNGKVLAIDASKGIDSKHNSIQINPLSHQIIKAPDGLYALGPLVGDNFVRCTLGGAITVGSDIAKSRE
uniref:Oxidative stress-induced growth inhibitor 1 n=1 Tax=Cacopsylla melanoneura TaxID=428564 RepID=A0A8D9DVL6_9HEMI